MQAAAHQRAAEAREALSKLQLIVAGPPTFEPLVPSTGDNAKVRSVLR